MKNPCRIQLFKAYSEEFSKWRELKLRTIDLNMQPWEDDVGAVCKMLLDSAHCDKKAFVFQMRHCTFQKVEAMYYKGKLTFVPTVS